MWQGMVAPAGTPHPVISQLNVQIGKILQAPEMRARLAAQRLEPAADSPGKFGAYIAAEVSKWARVVKQAGIVAD